VRTVVNLVAPADFGRGGRVSSRKREIAMSVHLQQIESIRDQALLQIEGLLANDEPTITVGGEQVPWASFLAMFQSTVDWCDRKLAEYDPYEVQSRATS
jgi:hypothetical protein